MATESRRQRVDVVLGFEFAVGERGGVGESGEREGVGESCGERLEELGGERVGGKVGEVGEMEVEIGEFVGD